MNIIESQKTADMKDKKSLQQKQKGQWKRKKTYVVARVPQVFMMLFILNTSYYKTCSYLRIILKNLIISEKSKKQEIVLDCKHKW